MSDRSYPAGPVEAAPALRCANCGAVLSLPAPPYCAQCGQQTDLRTPTAGEFLHQFVDQYVAAEGAIWRTLRLLLLRPGALTREYLAGRRRQYVLPLRLYLTVSALVLLTMSMLLSARLASSPPRQLDMERSHLVLLDVGLVRVGVDGGRYYCKRLPPALCQRLQQRLLDDPSRLWALATEAGQRAVGSVGTVMFVLVPVFALLLRVAWMRRPWHYAEHLVFALHLHAYWFLALAVAVHGPRWLAPVAGLSMPIYGVLALRQVHGGRWWTLLLRALGVLLVYAVLLIIGMNVLVLWAVLQ